jgi:hypothetical protein
MLAGMRCRRHEVFIAGSFHYKSFDVSLREARKVQDLALWCYVAASPSFIHR